MPTPTTMPVHLGRRPRGAISLACSSIARSPSKQALQEISFLLSPDETLSGQLHMSGYRVNQELRLALRVACKPSPNRSIRLRTKSHLAIARIRLSTLPLL